MGVEGLSQGLRAWGRGPHRTRLKTTINDLSLFVLMGLLIGWDGTFFKPRSVYILLWIHTVLSSLILLYQCRLLQKRFIADALSFLNFACGVISIYFSAHHAFETSLLYLLLGAAVDGFDGAAARKFGGTRFGVYSDDIADGMNYGIAPGFALYFLLGQNEGLIIGSFYAGFTLSRLLFFTLNKDESDPNYFAGIPSPVGGMIVMCSIVLFSAQPTWVTFLVGIACTQMVSFSTYYRHLGRALSSKKRRMRFGAPLYLFIFILGCITGGVKGAAAIVLISACSYGFLPSILSFLNILGYLPDPEDDTVDPSI
jgi:CDP-diacylglycerol--serine O-phosphatidyltransferase